MTGILGLLVLIADVFAIVKTIQSRAKNDKKVIWVLVIFFLPFLGAILWWFMGPKK
jgi:hypothetical protein